MFHSPALQRLCEEVIEIRMIRISSRDEETLYRWQNNSVLHAREGFMAHAFNSDDEQLISAALAEWKKRENCMLGPLKVNGPVFDRWFQTIVKVFMQEHGQKRHRGSRYSYAMSGSRDIVRNISWIRSFSIFLPKYAPHRREELADCACRMSAIFYLEQMDKWFEKREVGLNDDLSYFERIDAYWRYSLEQHSRMR
jgi:hypothetical protein